MKLELIAKNVYGVKRYYPHCQVSKAICAIKNTPTILERDIEILRGVGFSFVTHQEKAK